MKGAGTTVLMLLALAATAAGCGGEAHRADPAGDAARAAGIQKGRAEVRQPAPAKKGVDGRYPPPRLRPPGRPGQVLLEDGPFNERLTFFDLSLRPGERPRASGALKTGSENSTLITMALEVDFYDADGRLVGTGSRSYGRGPVLSRKALQFSVRSEKPAPDAVSALLVVPDFVNE